LPGYNAKVPYNEYAQCFGPPTDPKERLIFEWNYAAQKLIWLGWVVVGICDDEDEDELYRIPIATLPEEVMTLIEERDFHW
jgi:hypothetical protein